MAEHDNGHEFPLVPWALSLTETWKLAYKELDVPGTCAPDFFLEVMKATAPASFLYPSGGPIELQCATSTASAPPSKVRSPRSPAKLDAASSSPGSGAGHPAAAPAATNHTVDVVNKIYPTRGNTLETIRESEGRESEACRSLEACGTVVKDEDDESGGPYDLESMDAFERSMSMNIGSTFVTYGSFTAPPDTNIRPGDLIPSDPPVSDVSGKVAAPPSCSSKQEITEVLGNSAAAKGQYGPYQTHVCCPTPSTPAMFDTSSFDQSSLSWAKEDLYTGTPIKSIITGIQSLRIGSSRAPTWAAPTETNMDGRLLFHHSRSSSPLSTERCPSSASESSTTSSDDESTIREERLTLAELQHSIALQQQLIEHLRAESGALQDELLLSTAVTDGCQWTAELAAQRLMRVRERLRRAAEIDHALDDAAGVEGNYFDFWFNYARVL